MKWMGKTEQIKANNRVRFKIPWYLYIYIYACMYVCLHMLHKTVHTLHKSYHIGHCAFQHWLRFGAPLWGVIFARYGWRRQYSWWQPGRRQRLGPYTYSYRTQEAQLTPDCGTKGRTIGGWTSSAYSFLYYFVILYYTCHMHHLAYCTYVYSHFPLSLLCYYSSFKFINCCQVEVRDTSYALCVCLVL